MTSLQPFQQPILGHYNPPNSWHYDIVITPSPAGIDIITTLSAAGNETLFGPSAQLHCISAIDIKSLFLWAPKISILWGDGGPCCQTPRNSGTCTRKCNNIGAPQSGFCPGPPTSCWQSWANQVPICVVYNLHL